MKKRLKRSLALILTCASITNLLFPISVQAEENRVSTILKEMSLRDKVTQMLMVDFRKWDENLNDNSGAVDFVEMNNQVSEIIEDYNFGAIICFANNIKDTEQSYKLTLSMQEAATKNNGIPLLIAADQEGGSVYRLGSGTALPGNMALGAAGEESYSENAGEIAGSELNAVGINMNLAPVVDVNNNANNPVIGLRSYGDNAETVGKLASAFIKGMNKYNVIGCAKHFPGHGDTDTDSHYGLPIVNKSKTELMQNELKPYLLAIENGIDMIMTAHILYPQLDNSKIYSEKTKAYESLPATMSKSILTDLLKDEMNFEGIVITDSMRMNAVSEKWNSVQAIVNAINAGVDMICTPCVIYDKDDLNDLDSIIDGIVNAVESGTVQESRIDDAVTRILKVKENRGILDYNSSEHTLENALTVVGSEKNRQDEREIASAAVTVVKNENNTLPLNITADSKVLMLCPNINERAQLVMGWNRARKAGLIPDKAMLDYHYYSNATITEEIKEKLDWADTVIVISEVSSSARMAYKTWHSEAPNKFVNYTSEQGKKAIIMSADKPYDVQLYPNADAIIAVYGCKGSTVDPTEAMNEVIVGSKNAYGPNIIAGIEAILGVYGTTGKLPVNIPEYDAQTGRFTTKIIYSRNYGLTYNSLIKEKLAEIRLETDKYVYDGNEKKPIVEVFSEKGDKLSEGEDYLISYNNNLNAGIATVEVTGKGKYEGNLSKNFIIEKADQNFTAYLSEETIKVGDNTNVKVKILNGDGKVSYSINDEKIAVIDENGVVTGLKSGQAVITVKISETDNYNAISMKLDIVIESERPTLTLTNVEKTGKIKISWNKIDGAVKYQLYRSTSKNGTYSRLITTTKQSCINTSAVPGQIYYYKVRAIDENGNASDYSEIKYRTCDLARPEVTSSNISTSGKIKLKWSKVTGAKKYIIYRSNSKNGTYKKIYTLTGNSFTNNSVVPEKKYYYKVRAISDNSAANSAYSLVESRTCDLDRPVVNAVNTTSGKIKLSWKKVTGAEKYKVYRATTKNGTYKLLKTTTSIGLINTSVTSGKTYYYKVRAISENSAANSAYSKIVSRKALK